APGRHVTCAERSEVLLPLGYDRPALGIGVDALDHAFRNDYLRRLRNCICEGRPHRAVQVREISKIRVEDRKMADANVGKLLGNVRPAAPHANDARPHLLKQVLAVLSKEALTAVAVVHASPPRNFIGSPTALMRRILM